MCTLNLYADKKKKKAKMKMGEKGKPESLMLPWPYMLLATFCSTRPLRASEVFCVRMFKVQGLNSCLRLAHLSCKNQQLIQLGPFKRSQWSSGLSRPVRKHFQRTGTKLAYSPFTSTRPVPVHLNNSSSDLPRVPLWFQKHTRKVNS